MLTPDSFRTASLDALPEGAAVRRILAAALAAADPVPAVASTVRREGDTLWAAGRRVSLADYDRVLVVGAGKAGAPMGLALAGILGEALTAGVLITKGGAAHTEAHGRLRFLPGGHPVPDERSLASTQALLDLLDGVTERSLVFCLISGGGSALLTAPAEGVSLADLRQLTSILLACGATIQEINTLRKHLDRVKGGRLAERIYPAQLVTLILSDVVGSPLDAIASGPTVPDPTTYAEALSILERYGVAAAVPAPILAVLREGQAGRLPESPKPGDARLAKAVTQVIASNRLAAQAAARQAEAEGFAGLVLTTHLQGEARQAGAFLAAVLREVAGGEDGVTTGREFTLSRPACIVVGGETTVQVKGTGLGGRNLELALGAVKDLDGLERLAVVTLATDGEDGPSGAAGAVVTGETFGRAAAARLDPADYLSRNDSYHFFAPLGDLIVTGPTGTNVNDLAFLFAF